MADRMNPIAEVGRQGCWTCAGCVLVPIAVFCVLWFVIWAVQMAQDYGPGSPSRAQEVQSR